MDVSLEREKACVQQGAARIAARREAERKAAEAEKRIGDAKTRAEIEAALIDVNHLDGPRRGVPWAMEMAEACRKTCAQSPGRPLDEAIDPETYVPDRPDALAQRAASETPYPSNAIPGTFSVVWVRRHSSDAPKSAQLPADHGCTPLALRAMARTSVWNP
ncbi:hypothetical protein [Oceanicella actignis]|uniref:hypothetical protein n=1 Tax=Oceanicella actignis TaxID=1189325 RepID=UPI0011E7FBBB|nr:hypothetical protein [Oceanicella actignis]